MILQVLNSSKKVILFFAWEEAHLLWAESVVRHVLPSARWFEASRLKKEFSSLIQANSPSLFGAGCPLVLTGVKEPDQDTLQNLLPFLGTFPLVLFSHYLPKTSKMRATFQGFSISSPTRIEIEKTLSFLNIPFLEEHLNLPPEVLLDELKFGNGSVFQQAVGEPNIPALRLEQRTLEKTLPSGPEAFKKMQLLRESEKQLKGGG